jgi:4-amino-4-deoxy-L-arabinose transferase-like glycosyltransferase
VGLISIVAVGLRLIGLGRESLWLDEAGRLAIAALPLTEIAHGVAVVELSPPLYHYLLHLWIGIWGQGDVAVRSLSAWLALPAVPLVWALGRSMGSRMAGLGAALLCAVSPFAVHYGQEAAMYGLLLPLSAATLLAGTRVVTAPRSARPRWLAGYVVFAVLAMYTHYYAAFLIASVAVVGIADSARRGARHGVVIWLGAHVVIGGAFLPWLGTFWEQARLAASVEDWQAVPPLDALLRWASAVTVDTATDVAPTLLLLLILASGGIGWWRRRPEPGAWMLATAVLVPLMLAMVAAGFVHGFRERGFLAFLPAMWVLFAMGLDDGGALGESGARTARPDLALLVVRALFGALLGASILGLVAHYDEPREDFRRAAAVVAEVAGPTDPVFFVHYAAQIPFDHYFSGLQPRIGLPDDFAWEDGYHARYVVTPEDVEQRVQPSLVGARQVWAVLSHDGGRGSEHLVAALDRWGMRVELHTLYGVRVLRYLARS